MVKSYKELLLDYSDFANPKTKISREIRNGHLKKISSGLYEDDLIQPFYVYSCYIYNPSYISFDTALYLYDMIPERIYSVLCATYKKNRTKTIKGSLAYYLYRDIPSNVYHKDVLLNTDNKDYPFYIASKEKCLLDKLYTIKGIKTIKSIKECLFDDLRINEFIFYSLDADKLIELAFLYKTSTLNIFAKFVAKEKNNGKFISSKRN